MSKETSSRVSGIAAKIMRHEPATPQTLSVGSFNELLGDAKILAGSCLSQDETPGQQQPKGDFLSRLKDEREDLERRLIALNSYLAHNPGHPNPRHNAMLTEQARLMSELLSVLDERLSDLETTDGE